MLDERLKQVLTRKMTAGDYCSQRFFSYMPLLQKEYCLYMIENNIYDAPYVILQIVKDWCNERNKDIAEKYNFHEKIKSAIDEIRNFYNVLCTMSDDYNKNSFKTTIEYCIMVQNISLKNYLDIVKICKPYHDKLNSKLEHRVKNFKRKFEMVLQGRIKIAAFYENEIVEKKRMLELLLSRIDEFDENQLPIFVISYDLKKLANTMI